MIKRLLTVVAVPLVLVSSHSYAQVTVFSDNFNRASLNPAPNGANYAVTATADGGASIVSNILTLTNDASATANTNGHVSNSIATTSFASPYNPTLSLDGSVTWNFNMQQIRADPSGFASGSYGVAFILAGSSSDFSTGNGYAITLGGAGSSDPVRLVSYTGGIGAQTAIVTGTGSFADIGAEYLSVRVTYSAPTNTWELFGRVDGASAFADPTTGTLTSFGTGVNSTYTGVPLNNSGEYWNFSTLASQTAQFDNVSVAVPEPSTWVVGALTLVTFLMMQRRCISSAARRR
jgi:hypothetical protein